MKTKHALTVLALSAATSFGSVAQTVNEKDDCACTVPADFGDYKDDQLMLTICEAMKCGDDQRLLEIVDSVGYEVLYLKRHLAHGSFNKIQRDELDAVLERVQEIQPERSLDFSKYSTNELISLFNDKDLSRQARKTIHPVIEERKEEVKEKYLTPVIAP